MTVKEIRQDLIDVRYYYANKALLEKCMKDTGSPMFMEKVNKYNQAITFADPKTYCLYVSLYLENNTQESLATKWVYSTDNIQHMHEKLLKFFQAKFADN